MVLAIALHGGPDDPDDRGERGDRTSTQDDRRQRGQRQEQCGSRPRRHDRWGREGDPRRRAGRRYLRNPKRLGCEGAHDSEKRPFRPEVEDVEPRSRRP